MFIFNLHAHLQHHHLGNRGPDVGRIKGLARVATGLRVLYLCRWPSVCRVELSRLPDSDPPVYRLWLLMYVGGANTLWFSKLIDWGDGTRAHQINLLVLVSPLDLIVSLGAKVVYGLLLSGEFVGGTLL